MFEPSAPFTCSSKRSKYARGDGGGYDDGLRLVSLGDDHRGEPVGPPAATQR